MIAPILVDAILRNRLIVKFDPRTRSIRNYSVGGACGDRVHHHVVNQCVQWRPVCAAREFWHVAMNTCAAAIIVTARMGTLIDADARSGRSTTRWRWSMRSAGSTDAELLNFIRRRGSTTYHPVSTCRMGQNPMAVTDERLRVRGFSGLRVIDASIMPAVVSGNTRRNHHDRRERRGHGA